MLLARTCQTSSALLIAVIQMHSCGKADVAITKPTFSGENNIVHVHIPKTGGTSLFFQLKSSLNLSLSSVEACFDDVVSASDFSIVMVRNPKDHLLSQYLQCRDALNRSFRGLPLGSSLREGFVSWLHFFSSNWTSSKFHADWGHRMGCFDCYCPNDLQTRVLSCQDSEYVRRYGIGNWFTEGNITRALQTVQSATFVGLTDFYPESLCLLFFKLTGKVSDVCDIKHRFSNTLIHITHGVRNHSYAALALQSSDVDLVDSFIEDDTRVFAAARQRLKTEIREMERRFGIQILH